MGIYLRAITISCLVGLVGLASHGRQSESVSRVFDQFRSEDTTDQAMKQFMKLGPTDLEAKKYLAQRLPAIINEEPGDHPHVWVNSVKLIGAFRIDEGIPALIKWISAATEGTGGTLSETNKLDPFPCAKALVQIGEPAVPNLTETLKKGDSRARWFAYRALFLIGSPRAITALRDHLSREPDPDFKREIQQALETK